jgi:hypothetical protein
VVITITDTAGTNALLNAVFLDPVPSPTIAGSRAESLLQGGVASLSAPIAASVGLQSVAVNFLTDADSPASPVKAMVGIQPVDVDASIPPAGLPVHDLALAQLADQARERLLGRRPGN